LQTNGQYWPLSFIFICRCVQGKLNDKKNKYLKSQIIYEKNNAERKNVCDRMIQLEVDLFKRCQVQDDEEQPKAVEVFRTVNYLIKENKFLNIFNNFSTNFKC
jgi:hypothetical protein